MDADLTLSRKSLHVVPALHTERTRRYGVLAAPVPVTRVYRRSLGGLDHNGMRVEKWVLLNHRTRTVTFATTYNGEAGSRFDCIRHTHPMDVFLLRDQLRGYQEVMIECCSIAVRDALADIDSDWPAVADWTENQGWNESEEDNARSMSHELHIHS